MKTGGVEGVIERSRGRGIGFVSRCASEGSTSADGRYLGIQADIGRDAGGANAISLASLADGMVFNPGASARVFADDPAADMWRGVIESVRRQLGFPLEPELFSNMLVVALLAGIDDHRVPAAMERLVEVFGDTHIDGLYHFFSSHRFAGDIDCTATAVRARAAAGLPWLAATTDRILGSAAVASRSAADNRSHGKDNGALERHVFKVYLDDHISHGPELDRGLKHDAAVACNALHVVLADVKAGRRNLDGPVRLREFVQGSDEPHTGTATVREIVAANLAYAVEHLRSGAWRHGTRYYRSPDAFLFFAAEVVREFPELCAAAGMVAATRDAVVQRRRSVRNSIPLELALRANAARDVGLDATAERRALCELQLPSGAWPGFGALYTLGSSRAPAVFFASEAVTAAFAVRALSPAQPTTPAADPGWWIPIL
jgi:hypothetical protein